MNLSDIAVVPDAKTFMFTIDDGVLEKTDNPEDACLTFTADYIDDVEQRKIISSDKFIKRRATTKGGVKKLFTDQEELTAAVATEAITEWKCTYRAAFAMQAPLEMKGVNLDDPIEQSQMNLDWLCMNSEFAALVYRTVRDHGAYFGTLEELDDAAKKLTEWAEFEYGNLSCHDCIRGHMDTWAVNNGVILTLEGDNLDGPCEVKKAGAPHSRIIRLPDAARPDCNECPKVDLDPRNYEVLSVYSFVRTQQMRGAMGGEMLGLRMESLVAAVQWMVSRNELEDPDAVMERIWILDSIVNKHYNARLSSRRDSERSPNM